MEEQGDPLRDPLILNNEKEASYVVIAGGGGLEREGGTDVEVPLPQPHFFK